MASLVLVCWRDIPAQVIAKAGRRTAKRQLSERFEMAIDRAAMRSGMRGTDAYLGEWRRVDGGACGDDLEAAVEERAARLEQEFTDDLLKDMVASGGYRAPEKPDQDKA
ncbi:MAG: virulence factor [Geminicoccaceae bacterium]|nr:virulence factor [Geminicoccaceae bacterium]